jgi:hypothetical protein
VFPGLSEFFFQHLCPEHCIAIPLEHLGLLSGSLHDILQKATIIWVLTSERFRLLKSTDAYLHPLLGLIRSSAKLHRFQVASYRCRADKVIRQKHKSIPTSRGGLGHRCRTDRLCVLDFWRTDNSLQADLRQDIATHLSGHPGGCYLSQLSCCFDSHLSLWHNAFNRHSLWDGATLDFCPCQHNTYGISSPGALTTTRGRPYYCSVLTLYYAGFWKCSLRDRRHGLGLREGSGLLDGRRGNFFSRHHAGFISCMVQDRWSTN